MKQGLAAALLLLIPAILAPASAEVRREHLAYLERGTLGQTSRSIIQALGPPDFVILPDDPNEAAQDLRETGTERQLVWAVKGCQPVILDFDARGRAMRIDYSGLSQDGKNCVAQLEPLLTPTPAHSCRLESRKPFCQ